MQANLVMLQYRCHPFWDALVSFAMREWTPGARKLLDRRLRENHSRCVDCRAGTHYGMCGCDYFRQLLDSCCTALYMCLARRTTRRDAAYREVLVCWPPSLNHVFPFGSSRAVRALLHATKTTRFGHHLLAELLGSARDQMFPVLSEEPMRQQLVAAIFGRLEKTLERLNTEFPHCEGDTHPQKLTNEDDISDIVLAICPHLCASAFQASLIRGYILELYNTVCKVLVLGLDDGPQLSRNNLAYLASALWTVLPAHEQGERPSFLRQIDHTTIALLKDPYRNLHNNLIRVRMQRSCYAPTCGGTNVDQHKLRKCGKCRMAQYCARECQKEDWSGGAYPHKEICDMLQELFVFTALERSGDEFSAACTENEFPLERVDRLIAWSGGAACDYAIGAPSVESLTPEKVGKFGFVQADYTAYHRDKH
ncbi:hypothetical protein AURDEDRAFT_175417 [Auricularia subglabra TFB-10046 SS5]|uniref:MYND-type domain-containing protein n=1 Tax=Auricularia subglabra (strain TFB-10046 / SS5) TaxID=717982 RepID=J0LEY5_AURST|nr:hypothetical protein AURDEDRAFT_175417 [Auricularia subglabra TFB-10046 SS5]